MNSYGHGANCMNVIVYRSNCYADVRKIQVLTVSQMQDLEIFDNEYSSLIYLDNTSAVDAVINSGVDLSEPAIYYRRRRYTRNATYRLIGDQFYPIPFQGPPVIDDVQTEFGIPFVDSWEEDTVVEVLSSFNGDLLVPREITALVSDYVWCYEDDKDD